MKKLRYAIVGVMSGTLSSCVVSTYGSPGSSPDVPLPPAPPEESAPQVGPLEVGGAHILISFKGASRAAPYIDRTKDEARVLAEQLRARILRGEELGVLASEFSDDRGSAKGGGALGRFRRSDMVKPFSDAAFSLEVGGISEVVESPFGFHIIQRIE